MPKVMVQNWIAQTYQDRSPNSSSKRLLNGYFQSTEGEGKFQAEVIGTPGAQTFTKKELPPVTISVIQGNGADPNTVTVTTASAHGFVTGTLFNVENTTNYNENELTVKEVLSTTQFLYETFSNTENLAELAGDVAATGESPITNVPENSSCRGIYTASTGRVFACYGPTVFEIYADGTWSTVISIGNNDSDVSFTDDGFNLVFCDGTAMWAFDLQAGGTVQVSLPFTEPTKVVFLNGRIVAINNGTEDPDTTINTKNRFYFSELFDATNWPVPNYASAESSADNILAMEVREGELWLLGPRSYEVWRSDENPDLPFAKIGGSSTEIGCDAPDSTSSIAGQIFWLGSSAAGQNIVFMSNGYGAQRISTHAIEYYLNTLGSLSSDARGFSYQQEGHTFFVLTLIQGNRTFAYDLTTGKWHERSSRDPKINQENYWDILYTTFGHARVLCGGLQNARILTLDLDRYVEWDGRPIVRMIRGPIMFDQLGQLFHYRFEVDMETGVGRQQGQPFQSGIQTGEAFDPQAILRHSDDGGHTWSSQKRTAIGKVGQYLARVAFRRLGRSRERVYEFSMSAPVKWHILGARVTVKKGLQP